MQLDTHTPQDFLAALRALLGPGEAWQWPDGGQGEAMLLATAQELARVNAQVQGALDLAVIRHSPKAKTWRLVDYRAVAETSQIGVSAKVSISLSNVQPLVAGFKAGAKCWSRGAKFILMVSYDGSRVDAEALWMTLLDFKQAHVLVWLVNTGADPGEVWHVQN